MEIELSYTIITNTDVHLCYHTEESKMSNIVIINFCNIKEFSVKVIFSVEYETLDNFVMLA